MSLQVSLSMKIKTQETSRGSIGIIVLLLVLLIVSFLVIKNLQKMPGGGVQLPGGTEKISADAVIDKFKGDVKKIEELQNRAFPTTEPESPWQH
jgi:hypothetical protein